MQLPPFRLEAYFSRWEFSARFHLTASDAQTLQLNELLQFATPEDVEEWHHLALSYVPVRGTERFRCAVASSYATVQPPDVIAFAGAQEGLFAAMHALLERSDHAIVTVPNYQSMETVPLSICEVTGVALRPENDWDLDIAVLRAAIRPNTKLIAVNFPHNPSGAVISHERFTQLIELCRERGLYLLSDEVYRGIEREPGRTLAQAADLYERGLSLNVVSKAYGLPGLRAGWIACRESAVLDRLESIKHYLSICNAATSEFLAAVALQAREHIFDRNRRIAAENLECLQRFFDEHRDLFEWYVPPGGCTAFPRYCGADGVEAFCESLVHEAGVLLLPASIYRSELLPVPADRFRIGYGRSGMQAALEAFAGFLRKRRAA